MEKPTIRLSGAWGLGIILLYPSGVLYSNQVGGVTCLQPAVEGVYVPLFDEIKGNEQEDKLLQFFTGEKWWGGCSNGIDEETADFVDAVLAESYSTKFLSVNRKWLRKSCEAWIYVTIHTQPQPEPFQLLTGFSSIDAILAWTNSD